MSQRDVSDVSFDTWVRDLETVVDGAGLDRFSLLGISRGGAIAIAYAVKHPERVSKLVLYGAFPIGLNHYGSPKELEARRALISLTRLGWGLHHPAFCRMFTNRFMPNATPVHENWFDDLQRVSTSPENAARLVEVDLNIDVRRFLRQVQVPTLVLHCDRDQVVSPEHGRQLAAEIPERPLRFFTQRQSPASCGGTGLGDAAAGALCLYGLAGGSYRKSRRELRFVSSAAAVSKTRRTARAALFSLRDVMPPSSGPEQSARREHGTEQAMGSTSARSSDNPGILSREPRPNRALPNGSPSRCRRK